MHRTKSLFLILACLFLQTELLAQTSYPGVTSTGNAGGNHSFRGLLSNGTFSNWMNSGYSGTAYNLIGHSDPHSGYGVVVGNNIVSPVVWMYANNRNAFSVRTMYYQGDMASGVDLLTVRASGNVGIGTIDPLDKLHLTGNLRIDGPNNDDAIRFETISGFHRIAFNQLRFYDWESGYDNMTINNGNVGIGTTSPNEKLEVVGKIRTDYLRIDSENPSSVEGGEIMLDGANGFNDWRIDNYQGKFRLHHSGTNQFTVHSNGQVGIGTGNSTLGTHKLAVEGSIGAREIKVEASGWSDFVFEENYDLRTLKEVEQHINENGHLPEIPNEAEVTENGINLGEMDAKLLQKIEELTLYLIEQNKKIEALEQEVQELKNN